MCPKGNAFETTSKTNHVKHQGLFSEAFSTHFEIVTSHNFDVLTLKLRRSEVSPLTTCFIIHHVWSLRVSKKFECTLHRMAWHDLAKGAPPSFWCCPFLDVKQTLQSTPYIVRSYASKWKTYERCHMNSMNPWSTPPPGHASEGRGKLHCPTLPQDEMVLDQGFRGHWSWLCMKNLIPTWMYKPAWQRPQNVCLIFGSRQDLHSTLECAVFLVQNNFSEAIPRLHLV